jgi:methylmalonyl-CoA mutase cobalamin-binding subunit
MTVSLFVLGRNVPQLAFLGTLFGSETALEPSVQLYQRLLAMDADAAVAVTDEHGRGKPLLWVCDALLVPALGLAEVDRHSEAVDEGRSAAVLAEMRGLLEIVAEGAAPDPAEATTAATDAALPILIVPAADAADEIVAQMLAECLSRTGLRAEVVPAEATPAEKTRRACERDDTVVCISSLPPNAAASTRHLYQRIRARRPDAPVVIGGWTIVEDAGGFQSRAAPDGRARLVATLADAVAAIRDLATPPTAAEPADPAPESAPAAALGTTCS